MADQNFSNHARLPRAHGAVLLVLFVNILWSLYRLSGGMSGDAVMAVVLAVTLFAMAWFLRRQVLTVQDRVIRLECRLRMRQVLPQDLATRAAALSVRQLVAIRFASDEELPELVQDVLHRKLTPKQIKQAIRQWQADHLRA
jgi:hypothetical protein